MIISILDEGANDAEKNTLTQHIMLTHFSYSESVYFACVFLKAVLNEYPLPCTEKRKSTLQIPVHRDIDCNGVIAIIQNWTNSQCKYSAESILPFSKVIAERKRF